MPGSTHYDTLGLKPDASLGDITRSYVASRAITFNADHLESLRIAYVILSDTQLRSAYDIENNLNQPIIEPSPVVSSALDYPALFKTIEAQQTSLPFDVTEQIAGLKATCESYWVSVAGYPIDPEIFNAFAQILYDKLALKLYNNGLNVIFSISELKAYKENLGQCKNDIAALLAFNSELLTNLSKGIAKLIAVYPDKASFVLETSLTWDAIDSALVVAGQCYEILKKKIPRDPTFKFQENLQSDLFTKIIALKKALADFELKQKEEAANRKPLSLFNNRSVYISAAHVTNTTVVLPTNDLSQRVATPPIVVAEAETDRTALIENSIALVAKEKPAASVIQLAQPVVLLAAPTDSANSSNQVKSVVNAEQPLVKDDKALILDRLKAYTKEKDYTHHGKYSFRSYFFIKSQGLNRDVNVALAIALKKELDKPNSDLANIFSAENISVLREASIEMYKDKPGFSNRGMRSPTLNKIISDARAIDNPSCFKAIARSFKKSLEL